MGWWWWSGGLCGQLGAPRSSSDLAGAAAWNLNPQMLCSSISPPHRSTTPSTPKRGPCVIYLLSAIYKTSPVSVTQLHCTIYISLYSGYAQISRAAWELLNPQSSWGQYLYFSLNQIPVQEFHDNGDINNHSSNVMLAVECDFALDVLRQLQKSRCRPCRMISPRAHFRSLHRGFPK